jgi:hypothetical protein
MGDEETNKWIQHTLDVHRINCHKMLGIGS